jgi:hypothetical protein
VKCGGCAARIGDTSGLIDVKADSGQNQLILLFGASDTLLDDGAQPRFVF